MLVPLDNFNFNSNFIDYRHEAGQLQDGVL